MRAAFAILTLLACGDRRAASTVPAPTERPAASPGVGVRAAPAAIAVDGGVLDDAAGAVGVTPPDAAIRAAHYAVRLGSPSRVATVERDDTCGPRHASCQAGDCFQPAPYVTRRRSPPALVTCQRDSDCTVTWTGCCKPDAIDIRAARADQRDAVAKLVCGRGQACGTPDPSLITSFTVGCVEKTCQLLQATPDTWCSQRDTRYRVVRRDGALHVGERSFDCWPPAAACNLAADCYREAPIAAPRPAKALRRCTRDTDCTLVSVECCNCGARDYRAIRTDAGEQWRVQQCGREPVACPACVTPIPGDLAPACIAGSCEVLQAQADPAICR